MSACWPPMTLPDGPLSHEWLRMSIDSGWGDQYPPKTLYGLELATYTAGFFSVPRPDLDRESFVSIATGWAVKTQHMAPAEAAALFNRAWDSGREVALLKQQFNAPSYERHDVK